MDGFLKIYKDNKQLVKTTCMKYESNPDKLSELEQECWLKISKAIPSYEGGSKLSTWIGSICKNVCIDHVRHELTSPEIEAESEVDTGTGEVFRIEKICEEMSTPEEWALAEGVADSIDGDVRKFPLGLRAVYKLVYEDGLDYADAARRIGTSYEAVKRKAYLIRRFLYKSYGHKSANFTTNSVEL